MQNQNKRQVSHAETIRIFRIIRKSLIIIQNREQKYFRDGQKIICLICWQGILLLVFISQFLLFLYLYFICSIVKLNYYLLVQFTMFDFNCNTNKFSNSKDTSTSQMRCLPQIQVSHQMQTKKLIRFGSFKCFNHEGINQLKRQAQSEQVSPRAQAFPFLRKKLIQDWEGNERVNLQLQSTSFINKIQLENGTKNSVITESKTCKNIEQREASKKRLKKVTSCIAFDLKTANQPAIKIPGKRIKRLQFVKKDKKGDRRELQYQPHKVEQNIDLEGKAKELGIQKGRKKQNKLGLKKDRSEQMLKQMKNLNNAQKHSSRKISEGKEKVLICSDCKQRVYEQNRIRRVLKGMQDIVRQMKKQKQKFLSFLEEAKQQMMKKINMFLYCNQSNSNLSPRHQSTKLESVFDHLEQQILLVLREQLDRYIPTKENKLFGKIKRNVKSNSNGQISQAQEKNESISKISHKNTNTNQDQVILDFNVFCKLDKKIKGGRQVSFEFSDAYSKIETEKVCPNSLGQSLSRDELSD